MSGPTLVTGAAGFAGSHLLDLLAARGEHVIAWHRPGGSAPSPRPGMHAHPVDLLDRNTVRDAIRVSRPGRVYHCAGAAHVGAAWNKTTATLASNVLGTHHVIEALRDIVPGARVLIPSSALVYAPSAESLAESAPLRPASPYGVSKLAQEMLAGANTNGPVVCVARPFNHFGPRQDPTFATSGFAKRIAEIEAGRDKAEIAVGNLEPRRDLTDVRDTVRAYVLILEQGTPVRPYNVCSGRAFAVKTLLDALLARARVPIRVVTDPARYRPSDLPVVLGDPTRIREELGWTSSVPLDQTLDDLLAYWRARIAAA